MPRDPWDYHDCPIFELTITRWDGKGTTPKVVYRGHSMALPWAEAARLFASSLLRRATGRLRPSRQQFEEEEAAASRLARAAAPAAAPAHAATRRDATRGSTTPRHAGGGAGR
jgi:hypothetical protein